MATQALSAASREGVKHVAGFDFVPDPNNKQQIELHAGDELQLLNSEHSDWWKVRNMSKKTVDGAQQEGYVPKRFVREEDSAAATAAPDGANVDDDGDDGEDGGTADARRAFLFENKEHGGGSMFFSAPPARDSPSSVASGGSSAGKVATTTTAEYGDDEDEDDGDGDGDGERNGQQDIRREFLRSHGGGSMFISKASRPEQTTSTASSNDGIREELARLRNMITSLDERMTELEARGGGAHHPLLPLTPRTHARARAPARPHPCGSFRAEHHWLAGSLTCGLRRLGRAIGQLLRLRCAAHTIGDCARERCVHACAGWGSRVHRLV